MADGLNSKDPEVRAAFIGWKTELELRLGQLEGAAYSGGVAVTNEFARAVRLNQWTMARALQEAMQLARNQMPSSEPRDPSSPLRGITRAFGMMDVLAGGVRAGSGTFRDAIRDAAAQAQAALTLDLPGLSLTTRAGMAVRDRELSPARAPAGGNTYNVHLEDRLQVRTVEDIGRGLRRLGEVGLLPGS
jgi:hypothetical protein